ncbi:polysaccharide biosynthesis tyrosine autokinase [Nocardioides sp.]|uniref:polysaccharide biosynthesis tyrosine autokinase n=1 Tax=Nocardioides sp. TaxID=35761 RepID=UPI003D1175E7
MELRDYLRILRRRWLLIVASLVVTVGVAGLVTLRSTPQYQSTSQIFVSTNSSTSSDAYQGSLFSTQRVASYADLVTGKELAQRVIDAEGLELTASELAAKVTASAVPETVLLDISVVDPDPDTAQRLARSYSAELASLVAELETAPGQANPALKATIVDSANLPTGAISPQPLRNLGLALVVGLLLGFGIAVLREILDTTVKTAEDVTAAAGAAIMAGIAYDPDTSRRPLVTSLSSHEPRVEAFRVLRTNLQFVDIDSANKAFVVTSSVPGEGKSTTAVNTAITMAQTGRRILIIDGDLRRPQVAQMLGLEASVGVTTVLLGKIPVADAIQVHETGLHVLSSGAIPPNPAELLQSQAMHELLAKLRAEYDTIVIDAPPLLPVTDAALLAEQTDGALMIVRHGHTTREQLRGAHDRLGSVGASTLGVVFNMVPKKRGGNYGYGYGYGYGYAPEAGKRRKSVGDTATSVS